MASRICSLSIPRDVSTLAISSRPKLHSKSLRNSTKHHRLISGAAPSPERKTTDFETEISNEEPDNLVKKFGLEIGLIKTITKKGDEAGNTGAKGNQAKELLAKYGVAYLITSISLAIVSFTICYILVDRGVDIAALLKRVGLEGGNTTEKVGTFAVAYAAHKALSPVRFPPTVALTPILAKFLGKKTDDNEEKKDDDRN